MVHAGLSESVVDHAAQLDAEDGKANVSHVASGNDGVSENAELLVDVPGILRDEHDINASLPGLGEEREHFPVVLLRVRPIPGIVEHLRFVDDDEDGGIEGTELDEVPPRFHVLGFGQSADLIGAEPDTVFREDVSPSLRDLDIDVCVNEAPQGDPPEGLANGIDGFSASNVALDNLDHQFDMVGINCFTKRRATINSM